MLCTIINSYNLWIPLTCFVTNGKQDNVIVVYDVLRHSICTPERRNSLIKINVIEFLLFLMHHSIYNCMQLTLGYFFKKLRVYQVK